MQSPRSCTLVNWQFNGQHHILRPDLAQNKVANTQISHLWTPSTCQLGTDELILIRVLQYRHVLGQEQ